MNKTLPLIVLILVLTISASAVLECRVDQSCSSSETIILCLSDTTNAHAELPQAKDSSYICPNNYGIKVCCKDVLSSQDGIEITAPLSNQCSGEYQPIAYLRDLTNSHGAIPNEDFITSSDASYAIPACLSAMKSVTCTVDSSAGEGCVIAFSGEGDNSHFASCADATDTYKKYINCQVVSDEDGDSYSADIDCNDNDPDVHPNTPEIANGIDDDCDGLIDGDDPQLETLPDGWYQLTQKVADVYNYDPNGIKIDTLEDGTPIFTTTDGSDHLLITKKVAVVPNKEYIASINSGECTAELAIAFDDDTHHTDGQWGYVTQETLNSLKSGTGFFNTTAQDSHNAKWASIIITVSTVNCQISQPLLELNGPINPTPYNDIATPHAYDPLGITQFSASACCPEGACWNGFSCIKNMAQQTFLSEVVIDPVKYRCVDGNWVYSKLMYDWNHFTQGSCPDEGQCFVVSSANQASPDATASTFYEGQTPFCINNGDSLFDHYCNNGNWTSRTRLLAQKLVGVANQNPYTLSCGSFNDLLLTSPDDGTQQYLAGSPAASPNGGSFIEGNQQPTSVCFPNANNPTIADSGVTLFENNENTCINNVCVLKYTDSDGEKVAFATSLNKDIFDTNGFLRTFGIDENEVEQICPHTEIDPENPDNNQPNPNFVKCDLADHHAGQLWYSQKLNAVIYGPDGVLVDPSFLESFLEHPLDTILSLFQSDPELSDNELFVENAQNLRQVYLMSQADHSIRAVLERQKPQGIPKETIIAEYTGFSTPICEYLKKNRLPLPAAADSNLLEQAAGITPFICTNTPDLHTQRIESVGAADEFWPQLTNRLRTDIPQQ